MPSTEASTSLQVDTVSTHPKAVQFRSISVPSHRYPPLRKAWMKIYTSVYEHMKIGIRMNLEASKVELKTRADTPEISNLHKCADFVQAFMLGFDVNDAMALLTVDELCVQSFEIKGVITQHLSRAIERLIDKFGNLTFAVENTTKTADTKVHILGSFASIKSARGFLCCLILGFPAEKCLPPPLDNVGLEKVGSNVSLDSACVERLAALILSGSKLIETPFTSSTSRALMLVNDSESASAERYTASTTSQDVASITNNESESKLSTPSIVACNTNIVSAALPPLPLCPCLSKNLFGFRISFGTVEPVTVISDQVSDRRGNDYGSIREPKNPSIEEAPEVDTNMMDTKVDSQTGEVDRRSAKDMLEKVSEPSISTIPQIPTPNTKGKKNEGKNSLASGLVSPLPSAFNSNESSTEPCGSSSLPQPEAAPSPYLAIQDTLNQIINTQKEMQKQMQMLLAVPVTKEGKWLEAALGRSMEKALKANSDALWARILEENAKNEKFLKDTTQKITSLVANFVNKDLPAFLEKAVKELAAIGPTVVRTITPHIEKTISSAIIDSHQRGVSDKAVNQLEKSINSKLEATVARQIQSQFQTSGKQAVQDALKSSFEVLVIPAFEMSCKTMSEQVDSTFQKRLVQHSSVAQQRFDSAHSPLALALRDTINSASTVVQSLSGELAEGQRKLIALATAGAHASSINPLLTQLSNGPLGALHEKVEVPLDPTKELSRLLSEGKYEEAFTTALQRCDVNVVSWLCSQVDLRAILSNSLALSHGVLLSLLQQLACDIDQDRSRKIVWMTDVAAAINPTDPTIAMHIRPIFEQVYQILSHQHSLPTISPFDLSGIRVIMHVVNSVLVTCK